MSLVRTHRIEPGHQAYSAYLSALGRGRDVGRAQREYLKLLRASVPRLDGAHHGAQHAHVTAGGGAGVGGAGGGADPAERRRWLLLGLPEPHEALAAAATAAAVEGEEAAPTQRVVEEVAAPRRHNAPHRLPTQRLTQPPARRLGVREMQPVLNSALGACKAGGARTSSVFELLRESAGRGVLPDVVGLTAAISAVGWDSGRRGAWAAEAAEAEGTGTRWHALEEVELPALALLKWGFALGLQPDTLCLEAVARALPTSDDEVSALLRAHGIAHVPPRPPGRFGSRAWLEADGACDDEAGQSRPVPAWLRDNVADCAADPGPGAGEEAAVQPPTPQTVRLVSLLLQMRPLLKVLEPWLDGSSAAGAAETGRKTIKSEGIELDESKAGREEPVKEPKAATVLGSKVRLLSWIGSTRS